MTIIVMITKTISNKVIRKRKVKNTTRTTKITKIIKMTFMNLSMKSSRKIISRGKEVVNKCKININKAKIIREIINRNIMTITNMIKNTYQNVVINKITSKITIRPVRRIIKKTKTIKGINNKEVIKIRRILQITKNKRKRKSVRN